jgi:hypothetical protein
VYFFTAKIDALGEGTELKSNASGGGTIKKWFPLAQSHERHASLGTPLTSSGAKRAALSLQERENKITSFLAMKMPLYLFAEACGSPPQGAYHEALPHRAGDPAQPSKMI